MKVLTKTLIRESEKFAVNNGTFSFRELMYIAGSNAAKLIYEKYAVKNKNITVVCGKGNNGGDGCVIASLLSKEGANITLCTPLGIPETEDAIFYYNALETYIVKTTELPTNSDIIIDAVFGIGLNRQLSSEINLLIDKINSLSGIKIAIDLPSGVESDTGALLGSAFKADFTVTFIALKPCLLLPPASDFCGETVVADIGVEPIDYTYLTTEKPVFQKRQHNSHKGTFGTALLVCGSYGMAGAAILATKAALRSGLGIAKCILCNDIYSAFTAALPEAVCIPTESDGSGHINRNADFEGHLSSSKALLFGCGVGVSEDTEILLKRIIKKSNIPLVIDADGINILSQNIELLKKSKVPVILTPHPGEMARLCGKTVKEVESSRTQTASQFAKENNCIVVLKGANTIIAEPDGTLTFNLTGNPGMATGGSGDVLAGIMVSLLAQGFKPNDAAKHAVYIHGEAGDKAVSKRNERSLIPSDIIEEL